MNVKAAVAAYAASLDPRVGYPKGRCLGYEDDVPVFADPNDPEEKALTELGRRMYGDPANHQVVDFSPIRQMIGLRITIMGAD